MSDREFYIATFMAVLTVFAGLGIFCEMMPTSDAEVFGHENGDIQWKFQMDDSSTYHVNCYIKNGDDIAACTSECGWIMVEQPTVIHIYVLDDNKEWVLP